MSGARFQHIGILSHPQRPETLYLARQIRQWLIEREVKATVLRQWDQESMLRVVEQWDLVISIGGDGTMLRAARAAAAGGVPVLGVNMGRLGFLTETSPHRWSETLAAALRGAYWLEHRLMLDVSLWRDKKRVCRDEALNDVVMGRGAVTRLVEFETYIDGAWSTTYRADALIIATPTGSTAYALAVGGPILPPQLRNLVMVPVAAHLSLDRPMVLSGDSTVEILVHRSHEAFLTVDGQMLGEIKEGDLVVVCATEYNSQFLRVGETTYFYRSILDRMEPKQLSSGPSIRKTP